MRKTELLIPAGSLDVLKTAVIYGADAVYLGGEAFGLRAKAKNFTNEEIMEGIKFAHDHGVKVYITANILAHNDDLAGVEEYFEELKTIRPDALIISDPGVFTIAKRVLPDMEIHISTQANNTNYGTYLFWHELGAKRVVSARELSFKGDQRDPCTHPGGHGDRELYPRRHVHLLFRKMSAQQLLYGARREPGCLYPSVPLEIFRCRGDKTGRVHASL